VTSQGTAGVQLIDDTLIEATLAKARSSPRRRANHNLHASHAEGYHRFLNAWLRGTYAAPHRHIAIPKPETFVVLRGKLACFIFDDAGAVIQCSVLGAGGVLGVDISAGVWHTVLPLTPEAVCLESKLGPWDAKTDKEFAPWAPLEGDPAAAEYAERLLTAVRQV
jgi:cupin fold WbuC family metalloprotein